MDPTPAHPLHAPLQQWLRERHQALLEQVMMTWEEGLGRLNNPDAELLAKLQEALPPPPPPSREDGADLERAMDLMESAASQGEVLQRLVDGLAPFADRSALFVLKQGLASLFASRGFDQAHPRSTSAIVPPPELESLIQGRTPILARPGEAYSALLVPLSKFEAAETRILSLRLKRKAVALLVVDSGHHPQLAGAWALRAMAHAAEACLSHLSGTKDEDKATTMPMEVPPSSQTQQIPDTILTTPPPEDLDPKIRATAERLARVLVGDIELYFPQKVTQGRQHGNLYPLLREELERSRATFIDRFGLDVETRHRIFLQTLVELLCEGNKTLLKGAPWAQ